MPETNHAIENAKGWTASIVELVEKLNLARDEDDSDKIEEIEQEIHEGPLSLQVRGGWYQPGDESKGGGAEEFELLLSTGGPALRLIGELDEYGQPFGKVRLQWQDWFTPWTEHETTTDENVALYTYANCFYFGEG
jgi:hypothetical protein